MIVEFIAVDVMNMQVNAPASAFLAAVLACPVIAVLNFLADSLPIRRVFPFGYATLPGWVFLAACRASHDEGFLRGTPVNSSLDHRLDDTREVNSKLISNLLNSARLVDVLGVQPFWIMVEGLWSIVTWSILLPLSLFAYPFDRCSTAAGAQGSQTRRLIDWFAGTALAGLRIRAGLDTITPKNQFDERSRTAKVLRCLFVGWVIAR